MHRNCCALCKSNYKDCLIIVLWISLKKGVCFNLNHSRVSALLCRSPVDLQVKFNISAC